MCQIIVSQTIGSSSSVLLTMSEDLTTSLSLPAVGQVGVTWEKWPHEPRGLVCLIQNLLTWMWGPSILRGRRRPMAELSVTWFSGWFLLSTREEAMLRQALCLASSQRCNVTLQHTPPHDVIWVWHVQGTWHVCCASDPPPTHTHTILGARQHLCSQPMSQGPSPIITSILGPTAMYHHKMLLSADSTWGDSTFQSEHKIC